MQRFILLCSGLLFYLTAFPQGMQDSIFRIDEVVKTDTRIFRKEEAGMKTVTVDTLALTSKVNVNLSDLIEQNTTLYVKNYGRGALSTVSFRGTAPTHTTVTWNGIPINSPMLGMVDFSNIPVYVLDDVNIQYGGASINNNSGALGGNINLSNKVDWNNKLSGRILQGYGSFSTYNALGQFNIGNKRIQSKTRMYYNSSENDYEFVNKHKIGYPVEKNENADYSKIGALQEFYYRLSERISGSTKLWYQECNRAIPMVMSYEGSDTVNRSNDQDDITMKAVTDIKYVGEKLKLDVSTGYDYQQLDYVVSIDISGLDNYKPINSGSDMHSWYNHASLRYDVNKKLRLQSSLDVDYFNITSLDSANQTGYDKKRTQSSAFVGAYYNPFTPLNVLLEFRKDFVPETDAPFIYNIGVSLKPFKKKDLVWKSSFSRNFHNPSLNDLYWVPGGNPDLLPEEGNTVETGLQYVLNCKQTSVETQFTAYYSDIENWILWLPSVQGYWEAMNLKRVLSRGVEANLTVQQKIKKFTLKLSSNYSYTKTTNEGEAINDMDASVGMQLPFIPEHSFNALFGIMYKTTYINFQHQYYSERNLLSSNLVTLSDDSGDESTVPFYRLYAVPLNYLSIGHKQKIMKKYSVAVELKINNLFNETYRNILNRFMPRRYYEVLLTFSF